MTQRRQVHGDDVQAVEEVLAELAVAHHLLQVDIGGRDNADVHLEFVHTTEVHELAILEHAQDLALRFHAHGADLV